MQFFKYIFRQFSYKSSLVTIFQASLRLVKGLGRKSWKKVTEKSRFRNYNIDILKLCFSILDLSFFFYRIFTELAETFLAKMLSFDPSTPHFAITILDNLLVCCGHPDYEIPDITFNFWYR